MIVPIEKQLELAKQALPNAHVELTQHPCEEDQKALVIDEFTIWSCEVGGKPGYHVDFAKQTMGTRETPPDVDVSDVLDTVNFFEALKVIAISLAAETVDNIAQGYVTDQSCVEEEKYGSAT